MGAAILAGHAPPKMFPCRTNASYIENYVRALGGTMQEKKAESTESWCWLLKASKNALSGNIFHHSCRLYELG